MNITKYSSLHAITIFQYFATWRKGLVYRESKPNVKMSEKQFCSHDTVKRLFVFVVSFRKFNEMSRANCTGNDDQASDKQTTAFHHESKALRSGPSPRTRVRLERVEPKTMFVWFSSVNRSDTMPVLVTLKSVLSFVHGYLNCISSADKSGFVVVSYEAEMAEH